MSQPLLSADAIFAAVDLKEDTVEVPEWGGSVRLVQMTADESKEFTKAMHAQSGADNGMYLMLVFAAKTADGARLFTIEDVERLKLKNFNVLNLLQTKALALNNMGALAKEALKKD